MTAGALVVLEKPYREQELLDRIQRALVEDAKRQVLHAEIASATERLALLTTREREVFEFMAAGLDTKAIAYRMGSARRRSTSIGRTL